MLMSLLGLNFLLNFSVNKNSSYEKKGTMLANFHTYGSLLLVSAALYMFVRYFSPSLPMCLRCFMLMLSGPVELLFLLLGLARL